ncbi:hypothetical protein EBR96_09715, partial [bacterium]|nr:hypothetical protein [bacterium]
LYEDGYPVGELSEEIQAHPDFAYYLGPANRFETVRDSYGQYKSVGLEQEMTFRLIDKPKPFPNQNRIEYRGMTFSPVTDWTSHFVPIDRICQRLEVLSGDQDKRYTVYFSHPRHFLICAQHLAYRIQVDDDPEWFDIWQIRTWGGAYYETAVSLSDLKRFKGLPSSSELRHRNGKPVYGTLVDHPGNKDLVIERQTGSRVEMAVPKWLIQTQFPAFIYGGNRKERIVFWALMTDTYPRTDLTINVAVDGTEETLYWLDRDGEDIRVFSPDRLIRYHNVMDTDLAPEWIRLTQFEDPNYIVFETEAMADGGPGPARISFPRLALTFDYKHTNWISREVDGFQIAPNQTLFIWGEFRHYLVLIPVNTVLSEADLESGMPYAGVPFKILVPHISIGQSDGTQRLYHARLSCDPTIVFGPQAYLVTSYDPITRRFSTETTLETLNLALLFLLN